LLANFFPKRKTATSGVKSVLEQSPRLYQE
jgi:hypothetical protein